jgi:hypothetical protein
MNMPRWLSAMANRSGARLELIMLPQNRKAEADKEQL